MSNGDPQKTSLSLDPEDRTLGPWSHRTEAWIGVTIGTILGFVVALHYLSMGSAIVAAVTALLIGGILIESGVKV